MDGHIASIVDRCDGIVVGGPADGSHISAQRRRASKRPLSIRIEVVCDLFRTESQLLVFLDGAAEEIELELLTVIVLLIVETIGLGIGKEVLVESALTAGTEDLDTVCSLNERVIIGDFRVRAGIHQHVGVLDAEISISGTAGSMENKLAIRVLDIVCIMTRVVGVLDARFLDRDRKAGEIDTILRKNDAVDNGHGNRILLALVLVEGGKGHAGLAVLVHKQIDTVLGLLADFQFDFAC